MNATGDSGNAPRDKALSILRDIAALQPKAVGPEERKQFGVALVWMQASLQANQQANQQANLLENVGIAAQIERDSAIERIVAGAELTQADNARLPQIARKLIEYIGYVPQEPPESYPLTGLL